MVEIVEPPLHGRIISGGRTVHNGSVLNGEIILNNKQVKSGLVVEYLGRKDYFSLPDVSWNGTKLRTKPDSFVYRLRTADGAVSSSAIQYVNVRNVNNPTNISFSFPTNSPFFASQKIIIYAFSNLGSGGPQQGSEYPTTAVLTGFLLDDPDLDTDVVKVVISTAAATGRLTLNSAAMSQIDFNSQFFCFNGACPWKCRGSGVSDSLMIFVAAPSAISAAINGMTYQSIGAFVQDNVTISIYDGEVT